MSSKPKLVYAIALPLIVYAALTLVWLFPDWDALDASQAFSITGHLGILLLIVGILYFQPRTGCWFALAWCAFVPLEYYAILFEEVTRMFSGAPRTLAEVDVIRILLLMTAGILSATLASFLHFRRGKAASVRTDA